MDERHVDDGGASGAAVTLPLLGLFLLMPPIITLFARGAGFAGVPLIVIYIFGIWIALIVCAALLARRLDPDHAAQPMAGGESPPLDLP